MNLTLSFWKWHATYNLNDYLSFQYWNGSAWVEQQRWSGASSTWTNVTYALSGFSTLRFRFVSVTNYVNTAEGAYVDDIVLSGIPIRKRPDASERDVNVSFVSERSEAGASVAPMPVSAQPAAEDDVVSSRALRRPLPRSSSRRTRRVKARRYSSLSRKRRLCRRAVHGGRPQRRTACGWSPPGRTACPRVGRPRRIGSPRHRGNLFREASHRRQNVRRRAAGPFAVGDARAARQRSRVRRKRKCAQEESNPSLLVRSQTLYPIELWAQSRAATHSSRPAGGKLPASKSEPHRTGAGSLPFRRKSRGTRSRLPCRDPRRTEEASSPPRGQRASASQDRLCFCR